ncbi:hypothetical protein FB451DRAFT_1365369 [Mycena latifolia]|nr:hypothetical protein FB451DRAFT_1365369 [Mycena latifolia]
MSHSHSTMEVHWTTIKTCLTPAVTLLNELNDAFGTPFMQAIINTTQDLITTMQNTKRIKEECIQLVQNVHQILYAIVNLHMNSNPPGVLSPATVHHLGEFTETLHKIHSFIKAQQDGSKMKNFFRQSEMSSLLKDCRTRVEKALEVFKIEAGVTIFNSITEMQKIAEKMQTELLEIISTLSDETLSDTSSWEVYQRISLQNSSTSFSVLPAKPKIFHGRELELEDILNHLNQDSARIAILGAAGMGKTSLAQAALHHMDVAAKYEHRFFVSCDSAATSVEVAALIGLHLGLKSGKDLTKPVLQFFAMNSPALLVLDNLESPWEPWESRHSVEEFLSLLTDIPHLALMITMRGAERPAKVRWSHPCLQPLGPLSNDAAYQTFIDIADDFHDKEDINQLLHFTDNMPLAIDLLAHLVIFEGCPSVLARWDTEKTSLISEGYDKRSSLDASIAISLSSPRMVSMPGAQQLLSLLSILPDGLSHTDLIQSHLPIQNILGCKSTLLSASLAYNDEKNRLKSLLPIREHVQCLFPPSASLVRSLRNHFHFLLELYRKYHGVQETAGQMNQMILNLGNMKQVLIQGLHRNDPDLVETIHCLILLSSFNRFIGRGRTVLMDHIPDILSSVHDHQLEIHFFTEEFNSVLYHRITNAEVMVAQAQSYFLQFDDPDLRLEARFYSAVGYYYVNSKNDISTSMQFLEKSLALSLSSEDTRQYCVVLNLMAWVSWRIGDYPMAKIHAQESQRRAAISGNLHEEARALWIEAWCSRDLGDYKNTISLLNRATELVKLCGMTGGGLDHRILSSTAEIHLLKSEYAEAHRIHSQNLEKTLTEHNLHDYAFGLLNLAEIGIIIGASTQNVQQHLEKAKMIFTTCENSSGVVACEMTLADLFLREGDTVAAKLKFQQYLNPSWGKNNEAVAYCLERFADVDRWRAVDFDWASTWTFVYLAYATKSQRKLPIYKALCFLGDIHLREGDKGTAHNLYMVALGGFTSMDVHRSRAECMLRLGDLANQNGARAQATALWTEARSLFERSLQGKVVAQIDTRRAAAE